MSFVEINVESISSTGVGNIDRSDADVSGSSEGMQIENVNEQEKRGINVNDMNHNHPSTTNMPIDRMSSSLSGDDSSHGTLGNKDNSGDESALDRVHSSSTQVEPVDINENQQDEKSNRNEMIIVSTTSETKEPSSLDLLRSRPEVIDVMLFFWILLSHDDFALSSHLLLTIDTFETSLEDPSSENGLLGALHSRLTTGKRKYDELKKKGELDTRSYDAWTSELIGLVNNWYISLEKSERRLELSSSLLRSHDPRNKKGYNTNNQENEDKGDEENDEKNKEEQQIKGIEDNNGGDSDMIIERSQTAATNASAYASKSANDDFLTHEEIELLQMDIDMWKGILSPLGTKNPFADDRSYSSLSSIERLLILNALCEWHAFVVPDSRILECIRQFEVSALRSAPIGIDSFGNRYYHFPAFEFDSRIYEEAPTKYIPPIVVEPVDIKPTIDEKEEIKSSLNEPTSHIKPKSDGSEQVKKSNESKDEKRKEKKGESKKLKDESESKSTKKRDRDKEDNGDKNSKAAKRAKRDKTKQRQDSKSKKEKAKGNTDDGDENNKNQNGDDDDVESKDESEASSQEKSKHKKSSKEKKKKKSKKKEKKSKKKKHKHHKKKKSKKHSKHKHESSDDEDYESDNSGSRSKDKYHDKKNKDIDESRNISADNSDANQEGDDQVILTIAERRERRTNVRPIERFGEEEKDKKEKKKKKHKSKKKRSRDSDEEEDDEEEEEEVVESDVNDEIDGDGVKNESVKTEQQRKPRRGKKVKEEPPPESLFGMRHPLAPEMGKWRVCCNGIDETRLLIEKVRERNIPSEKDLLSALDAALAFMMVERVMPTRNQQNLGIISAAVEVEDNKYRFLGQRLTRGANKQNEAKPPEIFVKRSARLAIIESIKEEKERQEVETKRKEREMYEESIRIEAELLQQRKTEERRLRREQRQRERADQLQLRYEMATINEDGDDASASVSTNGGDE